MDNHNVKKFNYKFYKIKDGRFLQIILKIPLLYLKILIKEVSFQQINSKLQQHKMKHYLQELKIQKRFMVQF